MALPHLGGQVSLTSSYRQKVPAYGTGGKLSRFSGSGTSSHGALGKGAAGKASKGECGCGDWGWELEV